MASIPEMLKKLDELYNEEDKVKKQLKYWYAKMLQLEEDKEILQTMIMHQSNKLNRMRGLK